MEIKNLEDLRKNVSEDTVKKIVTEYFMEVYAEADKYRAIEGLLENGGTIRQIRAVVEEGKPRAVPYKDCGSSYDEGWLDEICTENRDDEE